VDVAAKTVDRLIAHHESLDVLRILQPPLCNLCDIEEQIKYDGHAVDNSQANAKAELEKQITSSSLNNTNPKLPKIHPIHSLRGHFQLIEWSYATQSISSNRSISTHHDAILVVKPTIDNPTDRTHRVMITLDVLNAIHEAEQLWAKHVNASNDIDPSELNAVQLEMSSSSQGVLKYLTYWSFTFELERWPGDDANTFRLLECGHIMPLVDTFI
jgi:hypothetical protein